VFRAHLGRTTTKIEIPVSGLGFALTALGTLLPGCFPVTFLGISLTAVGLGTLVRGAVDESCDRGGP
jgi:hypothetical protein